MVLAGGFDGFLFVSIVCGVFSDEQVEVWIYATMGKCRGYGGICEVIY